MYKRIYKSKEGDLRDLKAELEKESDDLEGMEARERPIEAQRKPVSPLKFKERGPE